MSEFNPNNNYTQPVPQEPIQGEGFTMADPNVQPVVTPNPFTVDNSVPTPNQLPPVDARPNVNPTMYTNPNPAPNQLPPIDARPNVNPYSTGNRAPNGNANPYSSTQYPNHTIPGYQNSGYQQAPNQGAPAQGTPNMYGQTPYQQPVYMEDPSKNVSTWSMVLGIVSCVIGFLGWGAIIGLGCGIAAIILGVKAGKVAPMGKRNGMATAGLICGIIGTCISGIVFCCVACTAITVGSAACAGYNFY